MRCASSPLSMPPEALSIVVDRRPRDLTPTVSSNPLFSSALPHTFLAFIDFDTSSPVLGFFQPPPQRHSPCPLSTLSCHPSRCSGPTSITVFWILFESLPAVGDALFMPAVGCALLPAVSPLFSTRCGSALLPAVGPLFWLLFIRITHLFVFTQSVVLSWACFPASLFASTSISPRERRTHTIFAVWCLGSSRACGGSTSCLPVHVLTHVFTARGSVSPRTTRSPPLCTFV